MLGVTLFGIFLTPVFFYVIEGLAETPLFASARTRLIGRVLMYVLGILTLGIPWLLGTALRRRAPARPRHRALLLESKAVHNGDGAITTSAGCGVASEER